MVASTNNKRIAKNTLLLYARMLLMMGVSLYTSRIVLEALGVDDFGIYNVVGGVVAMFSVLSNSLSAAISRFLTYELGTGNNDKLRNIFSSSVTIQLVLGLLIALLAETVGVWFLNAKMNIPADRLTAANWVLHFSVLTFVINLVSIPYNAAIIAHEKMSAFASISILDAIGKLAIAYLIMISPIDRLIFYSVLMCLVALVVRFTYGFYCKSHFEECRYHFIFDRELLKELFSFAGWNFIGASSGVLRDQGVNIVINLFCGPAVNAARGIAMQVSAAIGSFANNFMTALNPQITKSYASEDREYMFTLVYQGARLSFYLLFFLSLPVLIETKTVLSLWLNVVPDYTVVFVQLILIYVMSESISYTLITLMLATGNIRNYQLAVGGCQMLNFPISYLLLRFGFPPESTLWTAIIVAFLCLSTRLLMLRRMVQLSIRIYFQKVFINVLLVSILSCVIPFFVKSLMLENILRFIVLCCVCTLSTSFVIYRFGCTRRERLFVNNKLTQLKTKIISK